MQRFVLMRLLGSWVLWLMLTACGALHPPEYFGALSQSLEKLGKDGLKGVELKPGFEYILIDIDGRKTVMALGSREVLTESGRASLHERWYSGQGEMIHMVDGRIHTAVGLTVEWRRQRSNPPAWDLLAKSSSSVAWSRELDVMPGYRYGQADHIETKLSTAPKGAPVLPLDATWIMDQVRSPQVLGGDWTYTQTFAIHQGRVVYSEQCLAPTVCFKFKPLGMMP
jgi:hypothetical protein